LDIDKDVANATEAAAYLIAAFKDAIDGLGLLARIEHKGSTATLLGECEYGTCTLRCDHEGGALAFARELADALAQHTACALVPDREDETEDGGTQTLIHVSSAL
jgi:hypothetical protein